MKKRKVTKKAKSSGSTKKKGIGYTVYATEHDFVIIAGGGLVVLLLMAFLFVQLQ